MTLPERCTFSPVAPDDRLDKEEIRLATEASVRRWLHNQDSMYFVTCCLESGPGLDDIRKTHDHRFRVQGLGDEIIAEDQYGYQVYP